jgi:hypothetical protein
MKKTNNTGRIFLVILAVSLSATAVIAVAEALFGVATVFTAAVCLIPVCFAWILITDSKAKDKAFEEREKAWRNNCDLPHRNTIKKVIKKTN